MGAWERWLNIKVKGGVNMYVVSESGTIRPSEIADTLKAMPLLPGGSIIVPSDF